MSSHFSSSIESLSKTDKFWVFGKGSSAYFTLFEEDNNGFLYKSKKGDFERRQDCPKVYEFNGSMYLIKIESIKKYKIADFKNIKKIIMPNERSVDIDTIEDWILAEYYLKTKIQ